MAIKGEISSFLCLSMNNVLEILVKMVFVHPLADEIQ